ncbi:MAG: DUF6962 family protein [Chitinophagales bacterium]
MEHHSITLAGILITEPGTCFTDIILSVLCFFLYWKVKKDFASSHFINAWKYFFLFMSISTGIGVFVHGFKSYFFPLLYHYTWLAMNISAAAASYFTLRAMSKFVSRNVKERKKINALNLFLFSGFVFVTLLFNNFEIVKIYIAIAVTCNFLVHLIGHFREDAASRFIMLGMFISFFTIFIHSTQVIYNAWIDYKSISHLIMMMSILLVYRGVKVTHAKLETSFIRN